MQTDRKYTDRDVREDRSLAMIAEDYALSYTGEFEFMVGVKELLQSGGQLNVGLVRAVLNCMRVDPRMQQVRTPEPRRTRLQVVRERPAWVDLKTSWNVKYVLSTAKLGKVAHLLRPKNSKIVWYPYVSKYKWDVRVWCSSTPGNKTMLLTNDPMGRPICRTCIRNQEMYGA